MTRLVIDSQDRMEAQADDSSTEQNALERMEKRRIAKDKHTIRQAMEMVKINNISKRKHDEIVTFGTSTQKRKRRKYEVIGKDLGLERVKKDTKRLENEKFLSDPIFITQNEGNLKQTAIGFRIGTENELWNRRAVIWDLIGAVVETGE